jgi:hypothetical protein
MDLRSIPEKNERRLFLLNKRLSQELSPSEELEYVRLQRAVNRPEDWESMKFLGRSPCTVAGRLRWEVRRRRKQVKSGTSNANLDRRI